MGESDENILSGSEVTFQVPNYTVGQVMLMKLKSHPEDRVLQIESGSGRSVTSPEFLLHSLRAAEGFREMGLEAGDVVILAGKNGIDIYAAAAGALFENGIVTPIDPSMKTFEFQHVFKLTAPKFVFCDAEIADEAANALAQVEMSIPLIVFGAEDEVPYTKFEDFLKNPDLSTYQPAAVEDNSQSTAFIVCSSGTTGMPKGVLLSHKSLLFQLLMWQQQVEEKGFTSMSEFLHTSHFFWISGVVLYLAGICGALTRITVRNIETIDILHAIQEYKPKWCLLAPAHLTALVNHPDFKTFDVSSMRVIMTGGSALQLATVAKVREEWNEHMIVTQGYGCTEVAGAATNVMQGCDLSSVGHLCPGMQLKVVDLTDGRTLGIGQFGEFYLKAPSVMTGYINNEEETSQAIDEDGWVHTGDTGYYDESGQIFISGRIKEFIKYQNLQIAPAELEQLISTIPGIADVGVAGINIDPDTYYPMALVVKGEGSEVTEEDVVKCVNENMSEYKQLRGGVCFVDEIPRTPTGKIKRQVLQQLAKTLYMDD